MTDIATIKQLVRDVGFDTALKLLDIFKKDAEARIGAIKVCLDEGADRDQLRFQAHSLKGLCRTYGAFAGADSAMRLQEACDRGETETIAPLAQDVCQTVPENVADVLATAHTLTNET